MAKLQLYISKSLRGYSTLVSVNATEEVGRQIHDYRQALMTLDYDNGRANIFYLISYFEEGLLLTVIRTLVTETKGDSLQAAVYFPHGVECSPADVTAILGELVSTLSGTEGNFTPTILQNLRETFACEYRVNENLPIRRSSSGRLYAYAYFGGDAPSRKQYIDANFYQPDFSDYAGVILINKESGVKGLDPELDITRTKLVETVTLTPPAKTHEGFKPYIFHRPLTAPTSIPVGEDIEIEWTRPGFESVTYTFRAKAGVDPEIPLPDTSRALKLISPASFFITEQGTQRSVGSFIIKVNGIEIDHPHPFTYDELCDARVDISSPGYFAFTGNLDLASTTQALIQLRQLHRTYRFDLPLHTPDRTESIRIYLKTKKPVTECPIEGYRVTEGKILEGTGVTNSLIYVGGRSRQAYKAVAIIAAIGFIVGLLFGWLIF